MVSEVAVKIAETVEKVSEIAEKAGEMTAGKDVSKDAETRSYKDIKPESNDVPSEADDSWHDWLSDESGEDNEDDDVEDDLEKILDEYFDDLKDKSECPETIDDRPFNVGDLEKQTPEKTAEMREEFDDSKLKAELKKQWEEKYGRPWPKYDHDIYSSNGKLIRKAGSDYDVHHIQPLGMGGKNEASNITPLHAEVHYDKQGIHAPDSPYSRIDKILGGME